MSYFLFDEKLISGREVEVEGPEALHLLMSRRVQVGEEISLQDPYGRRFFCRVVGLGKKTLRVLVKTEIPVPAEDGLQIILFQSFVGEQALDFVLQKGTELGLNRLVLFNSQHTAFRLTEQIYNKKMPRWQKICWEAAKQSDRGRIPDLEFCLGTDEVLAEAVALDEVVFLDPSGSKFCGCASSVKTVGLVVGPEGGFADWEKQKFKKLPNVYTLSLGPRLLRAETAALAGISLLRQ